MSLAPPARRFDPVTIALHWTTALLIVGLFASAWSLAGVTDADQARRLLTLHRSLGTLAWGLAVGRVIWRVGFGSRPALPDTTPRLQRRAAQLNEAVLYLLLLAQPISGVVQSVARGRPFQLLFLDVPKLMARSKPIASAIHEVHEIGAWVLLGAIALHVAAALFHRLVLKDDVLAAMAPWPPAGKEKTPAGNKPAARAV